MRIEERIRQVIEQATLYGQEDDVVTDLVASLRNGNRSIELTLARLEVSLGIIDAYEPDSGFDQIGALVAVKG